MNRLRVTVSALGVAAFLLMALVLWLFVPGEKVVEITVVKEVPVEKIVVKEVVKEVPVEKIVVKEILKEVPIDRVIIKEVPVIEYVERDPETEKVVHLRMAAIASKFSPMTYPSGSVQITSWIFSDLIRPQAQQQAWVPDLVERWEVSEDGKRYTFYVRKNAVWHDGMPVTAEDVAFTFDLLIREAWPSGVAQSLAMVKGAQKVLDEREGSPTGINVLDEHTLEFELEEPAGIFIRMLYLRPILPKHLLGDAVVNEADKDPFFRVTGPDSLVGSGPFKFVRQVPGQFVELEANDDYYLGRPKIDRVFFQLLTNNDSTQIAMARGDIDVNYSGGMSLDSMRTFVQDDRFNVVAVASQSSRGYGVNLRVPYLQDVRVRQAILHALDRERLIEVFLEGLGQVVNTTVILPDGVRAGYTEQFGYSPEKARALLEAAEWDFDRTVEVITGPVGDPQQRAMYAAEQQMFADVGLKVSFTELDFSIYNERRWETYDYELMRASRDATTGWGGWVWVNHPSYSSWGRNSYGYANDEMDALLRLAPITVSRSEMEALGRAMNDMLIRDLPVLPIYNGAELHVYANKLYIPGFGRPAQTESLSEIEILPILEWGAVWYTRLEQWDIE